MTWERRLLTTALHCANAREGLLLGYCYCLICFLKIKPVWYKYLYWELIIIQTIQFFIFFETGSPSSVFPEAAAKIEDGTPFSAQNSIKEFKSSNGGLFASGED